MPRSTLDSYCAKVNSGVCTPITVSPLSRYRSCQACTYGSLRMQLTPVQSQKSTTTTSLRRCRKRVWADVAYSEPASHDQGGGGTGAKMKKQTSVDCSLGCGDTLEINCINAEAWSFVFANWLFSSQPSAFRGSTAMTQILTHT